MVRDRLSEFQNRTLNSEPQRSPTTAGQLQLSPAGLVLDTAARSQRFLQHVNELRESIDQLQRRIQNLQEKQTELLSQTVVQPQERDRLAILIDEIKQHTHSLRPRLRRVEEDLQKDETDAPMEFRTGAELRIRRNQCEMLKLRLNELLSLFNHTQHDYKQRVSKRVKRQLELAGERVSSDDVDRMLESKSQEVFYRQMNPTSYAAKMALEDATNRHDEILQLEQSISELNDLFRDMFELVHSQGQMVDHIAANVESATDFVRDAQFNVKKAVQYKKSAQRTKCIIGLIVVSVLLLLFVLLAVVIKSSVPGVK